MMPHFKYSWLFYAFIMLSYDCNSQMVGVALNSESNKVLNSSLLMGGSIQFRSSFKTKASVILSIGHCVNQRFGWQGYYKTKFKSSSAEVGLLFKVLTRGKLQYRIGPCFGANISYGQQLLMPNYLSDFFSYRFLTAGLMNDFIYSVSEKIALNMLILPKLMWPISQQHYDIGPKQQCHLSGILSIGVSHLLNINPD
jgi:hypothetical protein